MRQQTFHDVANLSRVTPGPKGCRGVEDFLQDDRDDLAKSGTVSMQLWEEGRGRRREKKERERIGQEKDEDEDEGEGGREGELQGWGEV